MSSALLYRTAAWTLLSLAFPAAPVTAQDFRVYTTVTDLNQTSTQRSKPRISLTLFHAGKVYDYIESLDETVIHDPVHNRFLILRKRHDLTTEITQDEVRRFLGLAHTHARELIADWQKEGKSRREAIAALEFQLLPEFTVQDHEKTKKLSLISPQLRYDVTYAAAPSPEIVQTYLKSADWTAQLNSILNPHALLPAARLRLNDELRQRDVLPVEVELTITGDHPVRLKAAHEWKWELTEYDRKIIDLRETYLRKPDLRVTPFIEFQRETLISVNRK
jgi:hypothetical protein